jgi:hypothetical protein
LNKDVKGVDHRVTIRKTARLIDGYHIDEGKSRSQRRENRSEYDYTSENVRAIR